MRYLLLIYGDEKVETTMPKAEQDALMAAYYTFTDDLRKSGGYEGGEALQPTGTATTVRLRDGKRVTTDGPFAETREQLGGFYLINCANLDEAIGWAAKIPSATYGSVEVRPILEFGDMEGGQ